MVLVGVGGLLLSGWLSTLNRRFRFMTDIITTLEEALL